MPRRRRRIIKGMKDTPRGFTKGKKRGITDGSAKPPPLYPGWAPGDRWGPGPNDVIPGGPPERPAPGGPRPRGRTRPADDRPHGHPQPVKSGGSSRAGGRPAPRPPTNGAGRYLGPPKPVGKGRVNIGGRGGGGMADFGGSPKKLGRKGGVEVAGTGERITPYAVGEKRVHSAGTSTPKRRKKGAPSTGSRY